MCKMKLSITVSLGEVCTWLYLSIPSYETTCLATCYQKNAQIFIFIVSQTSEVLFIKQNCRYLLWLVAISFPRRDSIWKYTLTNPFQVSYYSLFMPVSCRASGNYFKCTLSKICSKKMIKIFHIASKQCITRACSEWTCYLQFLEGFKSP